MIRSHVRSIVRGLIALVLVLALQAGSLSASATGLQGAVYALSNDPTGNAVLVWNRAADGSLTPAGSYPTGGTGTGRGLGSQGAIALSEDGDLLFAVDAGSNQIASFAVERNRLTLISHIASGGIQPISLTVDDNLLYVLNAGDTGNISGFRVSEEGRLRPLLGSTRPLSGSATGPAQVSFSPDGELLVVTEKATNQIDVYTVGRTGRANGPQVFPSSGATPFGFAFGKRGTLVVSEANGAPGTSAASSYTLDEDGTLTLVSGSVPTGQGAACWAVVTRNGRYAYTANAGSNSITGYQVSRNGSLSLLNADGRTGVTGDGPTDMALSRSSQYLYVRNGRGSSISAFEIHADGSLQSIAGVDGLPAGAAGLIAR